MGQARLEDDGIAYRGWTKRGPGGASMLTVVRSSAEALDLAEASGELVTVVAGVRGASDAANLKRLEATGVPVVAMVD